MEDLFLGIDVGTQGVRAVLANARGEVFSKSNKRFPQEGEGGQEGFSEQDPNLWWEKTKLALCDIVRESKENLDITGLKALSVTSTSGTIFPIDKENNVLRKAIMYNDMRAREESNLLNIKGGGLAKKMGYAFNPSFSLSKILWIKKNEPEIFSRTARFVHPSDYIAGCITGNFSVSDTSNVLKTGYDLIDRHWPSFIENLGISQSLLPEVKLPGEVIVEVRKEVAEEIGLPEGVKVCAGATDGVAGFFASGASMPGEWNTTLGTTLVVKGVSDQMLKDKLGRFYSHLHPQGYWLPGGASSCGGECLKIKFKGKSLEQLDGEAITRIPTKIVIYPLVRTGERCPFVNSEAEGFMVGKAKDKTELYAAYLEGVGLVEKWIYDVIGEMGGKVGEEIFVTGGGAKSNIWLKIRASILNKSLVRSKVPEPCFGAAIIASSRIHFNEISNAVRSMVKRDCVVQPDEELRKEYDAKYRRFRHACKAIGYE